MKELFKDPMSFELAITRRSWAAENGGPYNERLEFLGDAVLELCIRTMLFDRLSDDDEGTLTKVKQNMVNEASLADLARRFALPDAIRMGKGEEASGGRTRPRILADTYEAVLGALFRDGGLGAVEEHVRLWFDDVLVGALARRNAKNQLQEWAQRQGIAEPVYELVGQDGPSHALTFRFTVRVGEVVGRGEGTSKQAAQHAAALDALSRVESP
jgi:ribonuclease-3